MEDDDLIVDTPQGRGRITSLYDANGAPLEDDQIALAVHAVVHLDSKAWLGSPISDLTLVEGEDG